MKTTFAVSALALVASTLVAAAPAELNKRAPFSCANGDIYNYCATNGNGRCVRYEFVSTDSRMCASCWCMEENSCSRNQCGKVGIEKA